MNQVRPPPSGPGDGVGEDGSEGAVASDARPRSAADDGAPESGGRRVVVLFRESSEAGELGGL